MSWMLPIRRLSGTLALCLTLAAGAQPAFAKPEQVRAVLPDARVLVVDAAQDERDGSQLWIENDGKTVRLDAVRLLHPRAQHTATVLPNGRVLIWGGVDAAGRIVAQGEWFDPVTGTLSEADEVDLLPRAGHTATLLSDGRLLLLGGRAEGLGSLAEAEVWDWRRNRSELLPVELPVPREGHRASLLADGRVLITGTQNDDAALYDADRVRFLDVSGAALAALSADDRHPVPQVAGATPAADAHDVAVNAVLALRFAPPLSPASLSDKTVSLYGPHGPAPIQVVAAESGRLVFVTPRQELFPASRYTLFVQGAQTADGRALPLHTHSFDTERFAPDALDPRLELRDAATSTTSAQATNATAAEGTDASAARPAARTASPTEIAPAAKRYEFSPQTSDDEVWIPGADQLGGRWRTHRPLPPEINAAINLGLSRNSKEAAWRNRSLRANVTEVTGRVLRFNDQPLAGVDVRVGPHRTQTDADGRFVLRGLQAGHQQVEVDGGKAGQGGDSFGQFVIGLEVEAGKENPLKPIYLPKIRSQDWIDIPSPLPADLVVKSPYMPGFEVHLPAGTILRGRDGSVVRRIAVIPMPLDRTPIDYPVNTPLHMTFQPGGMSVEGLTPGVTQGIRFVYPNYTDAAPGTEAGFLNYDPTQKGWYTYGYGRVSADGSSIVPDAGTQIYSATGFGAYFGAAPPAASSPCGGAEDGDPVCLRSGLFKHSTQGPVLPDVVPLSLRTNYRPADSLGRGFGKGTNHSYGLYLYKPGSGWVGWNTLYLVLPDGTALLFNQVRGPTDPQGYLATHTDTPSSFYGATLVRASTSQSIVRLTKRDGTQLDFSDHGGYLMSVRDRYGRTLEVVRSGGLASRITTPSGRYVDVTNNWNNEITQLTEMGGRTWNYRYTTAGYLDRVTYPDATHEDFVYDANNRMTEVFDRRGNRMVHNVYDAAGRVQDQTLADGATYHFAYTTDAQGQVTQTDVTRPNGTVRRVTFHASGYPASDTQAFGTASQRGVSYERDAMGFVTAVTDPLGRRTETVYDADKRVTAVTALAGTGEARTSSFTYTAKHDLATVTDPWQRTTTYTWDSRRRLTKVRDAFNRSVTLAYGQRDLVSTLTDPANRVTSFGYDLYDLATVTDPIGRVTQRYTDPLGRTYAATDALNRRSEVHYDINGRVQETVAPDGSTTRYGYDAMGNLLSLTDALNRITTWTYDARQRQTSRTDALLQTESWSYSANERSASHTDRVNRSTSATFDDLGRLAQLTESDGRQLVPSYDIGDRLLSLSDSVAGATNYTYGTLDQVLTETSAQGTLSYTYDDHLRLTSRTLSEQSALSYGYDAQDRLTSLTQGTETVTFGYDALDRRTSTTLPNGVVTTATFDDADRLTALTYKLGSTTLGDVTYGYDAGDQLVSRGGSWDPTRLPTATTQAAATDANHRMTGFNGGALTYDAAGNLTSDGTNTYVYDGRDQLVAIKQGSTATATFAYDGGGRRTSKTVHGVTTSYRYDGENPIEETTGGVSRTIFAGAGIDERYASGDASARNYFLTDHLGSTLALSDASGSVTARYAYDPYGEATLVQGASGNPFQYTGRENDGTGLYYYRARYYSPGMKRFTQEDPAGFVDGPNAYAYVAGDPLMYADPMGLWRWGDPLDSRVVNFAAGFGDGISFFGWSPSKHIREAWGISGGVNGCSGAYMAGNFAGFAVQLGTGAGIGARALPSFAKGLSRGTKGNIGEMLSIIENRLHGSRLLAKNKATISGFTTKVDSTWRSMRGNLYYVESKFGTASLTKPQRLARNALGDLYHVERWGYPFFERMGAYLGTGAAAIVGSGFGDCECQ